jgi:MbtH protein
MNANPFEDPDATYRVLVNDEGQHSLWPSFAAVPAGWSVVRDEDTRDASLKHIANSWTVMRPCSAELASS